MAHVYLTKSDVKLGFSQGRLVVKEGGEESSETNTEYPFSNVESINVFGSPQISTQLVRECLSSNVPIGYFSESGHYCGRIVSTDHVDPHRQKKQILLTDNNDFCLMWAKLVVDAKINNSLTFLSSKKDLYEFSNEELNGMQHSLKNVKSAEDVDSVLGHEGNAAKVYFQCLSKLLHGSEFTFTGRSTRPPKDPVNALLSYGYTFLHRTVLSAVERHGLHSNFGFMHKIKRGHAALASDLVEEYRSFIVDKLVVDFLYSGEVSSDDFTEAQNGGFYMSRALIGKFTNLLSDALMQKYQYFSFYDDDYNYAFQPALDKKVCTVIDAIDNGDALMYKPFVWDGF